MKEAKTDFNPYFTFLAVSMTYVCGECSRSVSKLSRSMVLCITAISVHQVHQTSHECELRPPPNDVVQMVHQMLLSVGVMIS